MPVAPRAAAPGGNAARQRSANKQGGRRCQHADHRHFYFKCIDIFADILRRPADHKAGNEHRDERVQDHAVQAGPDAAEDDLPIIILNMAMPPARGDRLSWAQLVAPQEVTVVTTEKSDEAVLPIRISFPSREWRVWSKGFHECSPQSDAASTAQKMSSIAAKSTLPCLGAPIILPNAKARPPGMSRMTSVSRKFVSGVGFSNGCALLALKKPPPFVPICLIAICDAAGPRGMTWRLPSSSAVVTAPERVWTVPCCTRMSERTSESGSRI